MSEGKDRLKQLRKALNLSQPEFAESIGIPSTMINSIEGGKQKLSVRVALALQNKIVKDNRGVVVLLTNLRPKQSDDAQLRIEWLVAGVGDPFEKTIITTNGFCIKTFDGTDIKLPVGDNITFFKVTDDAMSPEFSKEDITAIDTEIKEFKNGEICLIRYDNTLILRKIYKINRDKYNLVAFNEKVMPPVEVNVSEIEILGKYIYKIQLS